MKRLKDIDFDVNSRWLDQLTDKERNRLKLIFKKYIGWKYPVNETFDETLNAKLNKEWEEDLSKVFMDGLLVGMLDT